MTSEHLGYQVGRLAGSRVLVLNWRDIRHPQAGGAEQYMHEIASRWVAAGARVTWFAARPAGMTRREKLDGIDVVRAGGPLSLYPLVALRLLRWRKRVDFVVDCQNGIPFFSPLFVPRSIPVVQVVHHVHQDQFATRFGTLLAAVGRFLEGRASRWIYGRRPIAAVSPSTRQELRRRLGFQGPIFIVPNGAVVARSERAPRDPQPRVVVVSRLVPHKRLDLLLEQLPPVIDQVPGIRVDILGDGPELSRLRRLAADLGLAATVTFHGYQPNTVRDQLLAGAWVTASTSAAEGWGCSVIEAAGWGVPCVALNVPGIRDCVLDGRTGWLAADGNSFGSTLVAALRELADEESMHRVAAACQAWAACFTWDRSADLLAGVLRAKSARAGRVRIARSDIAAVARLSRDCSDPRVLAEYLRPTDQIAIDQNRINLLLPGCDEIDAAAVLRRLGRMAIDVRLADRHDLLAGPDGMPIGLSTRATLATPS